MSLCLVITAVLSISPGRLQFFSYETLTLSCAVPGNPSDWTVKRNTSSGSSMSCATGWGDFEGSSCTIQSTYSSDSGVYWCESKKGECSNVLNIRVNINRVILESPALPVTEGEKVTLHCFYKKKYEKNVSSAFTTSFYKNNVFIGTQAEGKMILPAVSKSDEGFYKCKHPEEESPQSFLAVIEGAPPPPTPPPPFTSLMRLVCAILLFILYTVIMVVCIYKYRRWAQARADAKKRASDHLVLE